MGKDWPKDPIVRELVRIRRDLGLTGAEVAARVGVSQNQISYWETGARRPLSQNLSDWAQALGYELTLRPLPTSVSTAGSTLTCQDTGFTP